jgi:hypothetical protein
MLRIGFPFSGSIPTDVPPRLHCTAGDRSRKTSNFGDQRVPTPPELACGAKESAALSLNNAANPATIATGTRIVFSIINPMKVLVPAFAV